MGRHRENAAVPQHTSTGLVRVGDPAEVWAQDPGDPVVTGEALVDERVVGGE